MTHYINLTKGKVALIDSEDFEKISQYKWHVEKRLSNKWYAFSKIGSLSRFITNAPKNKEVDHINGNSLDNRKGNLRLVSHKQNMMNKKIYKNNKSGYKGVYWHKGHKLWEAQLKKDNKKIFIGYFNNLLDAANAYNKKALEIFGRYAQLN